MSDRLRPSGGYRALRSFRTATVLYDDALPARAGKRRARSGKK